MLQASTRQLAVVILLSIALLAPVAPSGSGGVLAAPVASSPARVAAESVELVAYVDLGAHAIARQGSYVHLGQTILDVSNPALPREVGSIRIDDIVLGIHVAGRYAHLVGPEGLWVVDVSDPSQPAVLGHYDPARLAYQDVALGRVEHPGDKPYAYVGGTYCDSSGCDGELHVVDVSDPTNPSLVGSTDSGAISAVAATDGYALLGTGSLVTIEVTNPMTPTAVGGSRVPGDFVRDLALRGRYAFVAGRGLAVFDLSNPVAPDQIGFYRVASQANAVAVEGRYAYVNTAYCVIRPSCPGGGSLLVLDIADLRDPVLVGAYDLPGDIPRGVAADGDYIYVAGGNAGLYVLRYTGGPAMRPVHLPVVAWSAP